MTLTIHAELHSLIPPLTPEEDAQLEANLLAEGCRDPLVVWQEEQVLLDGHNRLNICERHGLEYPLHEISLPDLDAARQWLIANQLGRRNLTLDQMRYYRGKQYALQKKVKRGGGDRKSPEARDQKPHSEAFDNTAQELALQHKVSKATIERDAVYAKAIDTLADVVGPEARQALLSRETKVTQHEVKALAKMATKSAYWAKEALDAVQGAKTPKQARQLVRQATREMREHDAWMDSMARSHIPEDEWPASLRPKPTPAPTDGLASCLRQAQRSVESLLQHLKALAIPDALDGHVDACIALDRAYRQVGHLITEHPAVRQALCGPPPAPADPAPPSLVKQGNVRKDAQKKTYRVAPASTSKARRAKGTA